MCLIGQIVLYYNNWDPSLDRIRQPGLISGGTVWWSGVAVGAGAGGGAGGPEVAVLGLQRVAAVVPGVPGAAGSGGTVGLAGTLGAAQQTL